MRCHSGTYTMQEWLPPEVHSYETDRCYEVRHDASYDQQHRCSTPGVVPNNVSVFPSHNKQVDSNRKNGRSDDLKRIKGTFLTV